MQVYVVGFAFKNEKVLLIRKLKPAWQAGFLNGVGGKCEGNENIYVAMEREFHEEVGVIIPRANWRLFCITSARNGMVFFFTTRLNDIKVVQMEDEEPVWVLHRRLFQYKVIDNLRWLIPMALAEVRVRASVTEIR